MEVFNNLKTKFVDWVLELNEVKCDSFILIKPEKNVEILNYLKNEEQFDSLMCVSGTDEKENFNIVYHLYNTNKKIKITIKAKLEKENPDIESISSLWQGADWFEREIWDLFGIKFKNHPDLRRIMLPEDWVGHPLRKDYEDPIEYGGINNKREFPCDK